MSFVSPQPLARLANFWRQNFTPIGLAPANAGSLANAAGNPAKYPAGTPAKHCRPAMSSGHASRFLLWVDAVGGFLVCPTPRVRLGQAIPGSDVEAPLVADLSRLHATIGRDEEGYFVEPDRDVRVSGQLIDKPTWLADGAILQLGRALKLKFSRPHPLSMTGRLDFVSHHRGQPAAKAILLMADTLVLGPSPSCHVVCRNWAQELVLHRQHGELFCRSSARLQIDGASPVERGRLSLHSRVVGDDFAFSLEEVK
jgi:hypothetical protein